MARPARQWIPLDCGYFDDASVIEMSDAAQLLDIRAMTLAKRLFTDGKLTLKQLERIAPSGTRSGADKPDETPDARAIIGELVEAGLWIEDNGTYTRRNWGHWHTSADDIEQMSEGGRKGNHKRHHLGKDGNPPKPNPACTYCQAEGLIAP
jgi:hypothetical protein